MILFSTLRSLRVRRFALAFVLPQFAFVVFAWLTEAPAAINFLSYVVLAMALGVCAAFSQSIWRMFTRPEPMDRADFLALGIFLGWCSIALRSGFTLVWRWEGMPAWMANTDFTSYFLFMSLCSASCHLLAPGAVGDRIPPREWIRIGVYVATAVLSAFAILWTLRYLGLHDMPSMA